MPLFLNESPARRRFKALLGQANHLLITILVGLSAVERRLITAPPPELRTTWNPRDPVASAARSRVMVMEMTLVRATDALDAYFSWSRREPALVQGEVLKKALDAAGQSVTAKFQAFGEHFPIIEPVIVALIEVMLAWRNRLVHTLSDDEIPKKTIETLEAHSNWVCDEFAGMAVERMFACLSG
jgi:hypothetical protein